MTPPMIAPLWEDAPPPPPPPPDDAPAAAAAALELELALALDALALPEELPDVCGIDDEPVCATRSNELAFPVTVSDDPPKPQE